jgi:LytS/YehU family sensor histidine kinase
LKSSQLEALTHQAELKALKSQVNPHFLFYTLNTIYALINHNTKKARETVTRLSSLLRYSLAGVHREFVTLEKEIKSVKTYLSIEKARFGKRLKIIYELEPETLTLKVPPMILQPLVENAIKHGISVSREGGTVSISALLTSHGLSIRIQDNGRGKKINTGVQEENNGIGLSNLMQRLEKIYGDRFSLKTGPAEQGGFSVLLTIDTMVDEL